jgi:hypothetical protein
VSFVADLQDAGAAFEERSGGGLEADAALGQRCRVEDGVEARQVHEGRLPMIATRQGPQSSGLARNLMRSAARANLMTEGLMEWLSL